MMYLGFDIGKRHHDAALLGADGAIVWQLRFPATRAGFAQLAMRLDGIDAAAVQAGLEATGIYWLTLHAWLQQWGARDRPPGEGTGEGRPGVAGARVSARPRTA